MTNRATFGIYIWMDWEGPGQSAAVRPPSQMSRPAGIGGGRLSVSGLQRLVIMGVLLALAIVSGTMGVKADTTVTTTTQVEIKVVETLKDGDYIDWTRGVAVVQGFGGQGAEGIMATRKLKARRVAIADAQRRLSEVLYGVRVNSETIVRDFELVNDDIVTATQGTIQMALVKSEEYSEEKDGSVGCKIVMEAPLATFFASIYSVYKTQFGTKKIVTKCQYTGIVINASRFMTARPAVVFRILNPSGKVVYSIEQADYESACSSRLATYVNSVILAKNRLKTPEVVERVGDNPLIIDAVNISGAQYCDIIITQGNADQLALMGDVMAQCRVIVVLKEDK